MFFALNDNIKRHYERLVEYGKLHVQYTLILSVGAQNAIVHFHGMVANFLLTDI